MLKEDQLSFLLGIQKKILTGQKDEARIDYETFCKANPDDAHLYLMYLFEGHGPITENFNFRDLSGFMLKKHLKDSSYKIDVINRVIALLDDQDCDICGRATDVLIEWFDPNTDLDLILELAEIGSQKNSSGRMTALFAIIDEYANEIVKGLDEQSMDRFFEALLVTIPPQPVTTIQCIKDLALKGRNSISKYVPAIITTIFSLKDVDAEVLLKICSCFDTILDGCSDLASAEKLFMEQYLPDRLKSEIPEISSVALRAGFLSAPDKERVSSEHLDEILAGLKVCLPFSNEDDAFKSYNPDQDTPGRPGPILVSKHYVKELGQEEKLRKRDKFTPREIAITSFTELIKIVEPPVLLPRLIPLVVQMLESEDWRILEAGVIIFGYLFSVRSYFLALEPYLDQLMRLVLNQGFIPKTQHALARRASIWVLEECSDWPIVDPVDEVLLRDFIQVLRQGIVNEESLMLQPHCADILTSYVKKKCIPEDLIEPILETCIIALSVQNSYYATRISIYGLLMELYSSGIGDLLCYLELMAVLVKCWKLENEIADDDNLVEHLEPLMKCLIEVVRRGVQYIPLGNDDTFKELCDLSFIAFKTGIERSKRKDKEFELKLCISSIYIIHALMFFVPGYLHNDLIQDILQVSRMEPGLCCPWSIPWPQVPLGAQPGTNGGFSK